MLGVNISLVFVLSTNPKWLLFDTKTKLTFLSLKETKNIIRLQYLHLHLILSNIYISIFFFFLHVAKILLIIQYSGFITTNRRSRNNHKSLYVSIISDVSKHRALLHGVVASSP